MFTPNALDFAASFLASLAAGFEPGIFFWRSLRAHFQFCFSLLPSLTGKAVFLSTVGIYVREVT